MAKRFTDTGKWSKPFVRGLSPTHKLLWVYIIDACDHAGVWDVEMDVAAMRLGFDDLDESECLAAFGDHVVPVDGKWFIPDFIRFQYGDLNESNRVHASVIQRLNALGIDHKKQGACKPLTRPLQGCKDKDKDKDKDNKRDQNAKKRPDDLELSDLPESIRTDAMLAAWREWIADRREKKTKAYTSRGVSGQLKRLAEWGEARAIAAIHASIRQNYTGIFEESSNTRAANRAASSRTYTGGTRTASWGDIPE